MLEHIAYKSFRISAKKITERVIEAVLINLCTMTIRDIIKGMKEKKKAEVHWHVCIMHDRYYVSSDTGTRTAKSEVPELEKIEG